MSDPKPKGPGKPKTGIDQSYRMLGIGVELGIVIGGMAYVGYLIDQHYDTQPWGAFIGSMLGIIGGCYNATREAFASQKKDRQSKEK